jgi:hypothetical protein
MGKLEALERTMRVWAENAPQNFGHQHQLILAEVARIRGDYFEALSCCERAIQSAREHGFVNVEALACELAARVCLKRGRRRVAAAYLHDAGDLYRQWGAYGKLAQMDHEYREIAGNLAFSSTAAKEPVSTSLDVAAILKVSQAISGEMIMSQLVERLLHIVLEDAGAERALMLSPRAGVWRVGVAGEVGADGVSLRTVRCFCDRRRQLRQPHSRVPVEPGRAIRRPAHRGRLRPRPRRQVGHVRTHRSPAGIDRDSVPREQPDTERIHG